MSARDYSQLYESTPLFWRNIQFLQCIKCNKFFGDEKTAREHRCTSKPGPRCCHLWTYSIFHGEDDGKEKTQIERFCTFCSARQNLFIDGLRFRNIPGDEVNTICATIWKAENGD